MKISPFLTRSWAGFLVAIILLANSKSRPNTTILRMIFKNYSRDFFFLDSILLLYNSIQYESSSITKDWWIFSVNYDLLGSFLVLIKIRETAYIWMSNAWKHDAEGSSATCVSASISWLVRLFLKIKFLTVHSFGQIFTLKKHECYDMYFLKVIIPLHQFCLLRLPHYIWLKLRMFLLCKYWRWQKRQQSEIIYYWHLGATSERPFITSTYNA